MDFFLFGKIVDTSSGSEILHNSLDPLMIKKLTVEIINPRKMLPYEYKFYNERYY